MGVRQMALPEISSGLKVGYARVSTADQSLMMQTEALKKAGVLDDNLHVEKKSGASQNRPALKLALKDLRAGDTLVVWKLDRLSCNPREIYEILDLLDKKGCSVQSITEGFDAKTAVGQLFIGVSAAFAAFERGLTIERTKAGIAAIKDKRDRGEKWQWGRKATMTPAKIKQVGEMLNSGMSGPVIAEKMKVSTAAIYGYWQLDRSVEKRKFIRKKPKL
jgi:DNA invertase Pin-like site-specific DNA recombinase